MELLSEVVHNRLQELNLYRAFLAKKGLSEEFAHLLESARAVSEKWGRKSKSKVHSLIPTRKATR